MTRQRFRRYPILAAAWLAALLASACGQSKAPGCGQLAAARPWVRTAPAGADVMAAYFTLVNKGDKKVRVNGVTSPQFDHAELHRTVIDDNGQASMQPLDQVTVAGGNRVAFAPGGRHVMLFTPSQQVAAGDPVRLTLSCGSRHAKLAVAAVVRAGRPGANDTAAAGRRDNKP